MTSKQAIIKYYDGADFDYRVIWRDKESLGMHMGFWYPETKSHGESLVNHTKFMADLARIKPGMKVLDAGCGVGGSSLWLAAKYNVEAYGITLSRKQVAKAIKYAQQRKINNVHFSVKDFHNTKFKKNFFDVVWAQESLPHSSNIGKFIKETKKILKPKGKLVISYSFSGKKAVGANAKILESFQHRWAMARFISPTEMKQLLKKNSFNNITHRDTTQLIVPSINRLMRYYNVTRPFRGIVEGLGLRNYGQRQNYQGTREGVEAFRRGLWTHGVVVAQKK